MLQLLWRKGIHISSDDEVAWAESLLKLSSPYSHSDIESAQRALAKIVHPDAGGSHAAFIEVTKAARILLERNETPNRSLDATFHGAKSDHPSFSIDVLPVDAYEYIFVAANVLGQVADEDPPYSLQVLMNDPLHCWCLISIVPEAGGSIVSIAVHNADDSHHRNFNLEHIRDSWVNTINEVQLP